MTDVQRALLQRIAGGDPSDAARVLASAILDLDARVHVNEECKAPRGGSHMWADGPPGVGLFCTQCNTQGPPR